MNDDDLDRLDALSVLHALRKLFETKADVFMDPKLARQLRDLLDQLERRLGV
jgi:hypothetical protein